MTLVYGRLRELVENGQRKGRRLAGTGLGDTQYIPAVEKFGDGPRLDWRRGDMISGFQSTLDRIGQAELREITVSHVNILMHQAVRNASSTQSPAWRLILLRARPERDDF